MNFWKVNKLPVLSRETNCTKFENTYVEDSTPDSRLETAPECDSEDYRE